MSSMFEMFVDTFLDVSRVGQFHDDAESLAAFVKYGLFVVDDVRMTDRG